MTIETEFNLGQRIWVIRDSKATPIEVKVITLTEHGIEYGEGRFPTFPEAESFPSKEELGKYVMSE